MPGPGEFELIARYFAHPVRERRGVGDDCALIDCGEQTLALTSDLLVEGTHFLPGADPRRLGHKALAVNLSDLAAAGARPRCFLLALALPVADPAWLEAFSGGLLDLARAQGCELVGGDTTRSPQGPQGSGPLTICITAIGEVDRAQARGRDGARPGDDLWVSGLLGEAALGLDLRRGAAPAAAQGLAPALRSACFDRMDCPQPRVALGLALRGLASAAADVSDGLVGDLGHILARSQVGAHIEWPRLPLAPAVAALDEADRHRYVLAGGDDYELVFTAPAAQRARIEALAGQGHAVARIGQIIPAQGSAGQRGPDQHTSGQHAPGQHAPGNGLLITDAQGRAMGTKLAAFDHFAPVPGGEPPAPGATPAHGH